MAKWVSVAAGNTHSLALDDQGRLWAWGSNVSGQLGDGTNTSHFTPILVSSATLGGAKWVSVAAGDSYTLALDDQGRLWAWGSNYVGRLGDGTTTDRAMPTLVNSRRPRRAKWVSVAAGHMHTLALDDQGRLWAWGSNSCANVGDGTITDRSAPTREFSRTRQRKMGVCCGGN